MFAPSSTLDSFSLKGKIKLSGADDGYHLDTFQISTDHGGGLEVTANGAIPVKSRAYGYDLQISILSRDPSRIGKTFFVSMPQLNALYIAGRLRGGKEDIHFNGTTAVGKTRLITVIHRNVGNETPRMRVSLKTPNIYLADLGLDLDMPAEEASQKNNSDGPAKGRLFGDQAFPLDLLKAVDMAFRLNAEKVTGENVVLSNLDVDMSLENGNLRIYPVHVKYTGGYVSADLSVDTGKPIPSLSMKLDVEDIDIKKILSYLHKPAIAEGMLNLSVDLQGGGLSPHQVVSSLNGKISAAIENGKIRREVDLMAADAIDLLTNAWATNKYIDLNCMATHLIFEKGMGKVKLLYFNTPKLEINGTGIVDLKTETIDLAITPLKKEVFLQTHLSVRIKGPLLSPSMGKMKLKDTVKLYGKILLPDVILTTRTLGPLWDTLINDKDELSPCFGSNRRPE
jgi:uncharacterized protein involved in outer membrane biogenesis